MRSRFIVSAQPDVKIGLQLVERPVHFLAERHPIELVQRSLVEALADAVIRLDAPGAFLVQLFSPEESFMVSPSGM